MQQQQQQRRTPSRCRRSSSTRLMAQRQCWSQRRWRGRCGRITADAPRARQGGEISRCCPNALCWSGMRRARAMWTHSRWVLLLWGGWAVVLLLWVGWCAGVAGIQRGQWGPIQVWGCRKRCCTDGDPVGLLRRLGGVFVCWLGSGRGEAIQDSLSPPACSTPLYRTPASC